MTPSFWLAELLVFLIGQCIVWSGYATLQTIIRNLFTAEGERLGKLIEAALTDAIRDVLQQLLVRENTLSDLAAPKQDAKSFRCRQVKLER